MNRPVHSEGQEITDSRLLVPGDEVGVFDGDILLAHMLILEIHKTGDLPRSHAAKAAAPLETHWHTAQTVTEAGRLAVHTPTEPGLLVPGGIFVGTKELALPFGHVSAAHSRADERGRAAVPVELLPGWRRLWRSEWRLRYIGHHALGQD